jgi:hypothetical protein
MRCEGSEKGSAILVDPAPANVLNYKRVYHPSLEMSDRAIDTLNDQRIDVILQGDQQLKHKKQLQSSWRSFAILEPALQGTPETGNLHQHVSSLVLILYI